MTYIIRYILDNTDEENAIDIHTGLATTIISNNLEYSKRTLLNFQVV